VLANRLAWHPTSGVSTGVAWLAAEGFDAALLDEVRPTGPFAKPTESREAQAFYECLAAVARGSREDLFQIARQEIVAAVERWQALGAAAAAERKALSPPQLQDAAASREFAKREETLRRQEALATAVARQAERGCASVLPLYFEPADQMGRAVLLEGTARRAVRVTVDSDAAPRGLSEYFELDVFTNDSQNWPVICCAVSLPEGFPWGDRIHEPVRVAGVSFKRWSYVRRSGASRASTAPGKMVAPLVVAAEPQWLKVAGRGAPSVAGAWLGGAFAAALAGAWFFAARAARRDRLARSAQSRYDASFGPIVEPSDAAEPK
jgi:hypothetical protein